MKAPNEGLYGVCSRYRVVCGRCWPSLRVLRLLRVVFKQNLCRFFEGRNVPFARLGVFHIVFFLFVVFISINPTKAYADTYIGGPYKNVNDAGLSYLGYNYDALETESEHTALNELVATPDKYPDYTFWVDSFYEQFDPLNLNPGYYWSKYDGMIFVDLTDKARADVKKAFKAAEDYNMPSSDGDIRFVVDYVSSEGSSVGRQNFLTGEDGKRYTMFYPSLGDYVSFPTTVYFNGLSIPESPLGYKTRLLVVASSGNSTGSMNNTTLTLWLYRIPIADGVEEITKTNASGTEYVSGYRNNTGHDITWYVTTTNIILNKYDNGVIYVTQFGSISFGTRTSQSGNKFGELSTSPFYGMFYCDDAFYTPTPDPDPDPDPDEPVAKPETPTPPELPAPDLPDEPDVPESPDLSDLLAALDEHCQHIQLAIYNGLDDYYKSITRYYEDVTKWLADTYKYYDNELDKRFQVLFNYLRSTNQYLKNIDDNVQEILDKLDGLGEQIGLGDIPDSYDNNNVATNGSSALSNAYNSIRNKFPFSVLDNLLTLATSLNHDAVAPVVSLPVGNPFGSEPYMVEMDFSDWSDLAAIVRTGELVVAYLGMSKSAIKMWTGGEGESE